MRVSMFRIRSNQNEITSETFKSVKLFVLAGTHDKFTEDEFRHMKVRISA